MKRLFAALCATGALVLATPAYPQVVTTTDQTTGTPLNNKIDESTTNTDNDKVTVYGSTASGGASSDVRFIGGNTLLTSEAAATTLGSLVAGDLDVTPGGGFAFVSDGPADGVNNLFAIIIDPDELFTDMKFAVQLTGEGSFDLYYLLDGGPAFVNAATFTTDNKGNTNYLIDVTGGSFDAIQIFSSGASIFELKQISMNEVDPVPEPATWALMLLGFGCIGWRIRRRNSRTIAQLA